MFKRLLPVLFALTALPGWATTTFTSLASMHTANPGLSFTNVDFSGLGSYTPAGTFVSTGVTFTAAAGTLSNGALSWPSGLVLKTTSSGGMTIILPSSATAFGAYLGFTSTATPITINGGGADSFSFTLSPSASNSPVYLGIVSSVPFSTISFTPDVTTKFVALNGVSYGIETSGSGPEAPEPSTLALVGSGLVLFPLIARRKRRK